MELVCASSLRPGYAPPATIQSDGVVSGAAKRFIHLLDADGRSTHWRDEFEQLADTEADALTTFLINLHCEDGSLAAT